MDPGTNRSNRQREGSRSCRGAPQTAASPGGGGWALADVGGLCGRVLGGNSWCFKVVVFFEKDFCCF